MTNFKESDFNFSKQGFVLYGRDDELFKPVRVSDINPFYKRSSLETSYGEMSIAQNTPFIQEEPIFNFFPENFESIAFSGASTSVVDREFEIQTNTNSGAYCEIKSQRSLNYKAGYGNLARLAARFPNGGVENSNQFVGLMSLEAEVGFGYSGQHFGIWYKYDGQPEIRKLTLTSAAVGSETASVTINDSLYSIPISATGTALNVSQISSFLETGAAGFNSWQNGNDLYISYEIDGPVDGTFSYSSNGSSAGAWSRELSGSYKYGHFIPQTSWNIDTRTGSNFTFRNLFQINYQNISYGGIKFSIENPETTEFEPVHLIKNTNGSSFNNPLSNPYLHLGMYAESEGSSENIKVYSSSLSAFMQGKPCLTRNTNSIYNTKQVGETLTNLFTIRTKRLVNSILNHSEMQPLVLTCFTEANKGALIKLILNADVSGVTDFRDVDSNLICEYDVSGTTISSSAGQEIFSCVVPVNSSQVISLENIRLRISEGTTLTVAAKIIGSSAADTSASLVWYEDI